MYLLDSNVLSELRPGKAAQSPIVRAWAATVPLKLFFLSSITILEQEEGVLREERRMPPGGQALRRWAMQVHELFAAASSPSASARPCFARRCTCPTQKAGATR